MKLLEGRLQSEAQFARLHSAAQQWSQNGGKLTVEVLPEDTRASPFVVKHRVLAACFKLKSKAFMLTYNSNNFTPASWGDFKAFVVAVATKFGAKAWAACLEKSLHSATPFHMVTDDPGSVHSSATWRSSEPPSLLPYPSGSEDSESDIPGWTL